MVVLFPGPFRLVFVEIRSVGVDGGKHVRAREWAIRRKLFICKIRLVLWMLFGASASSEQDFLWTEGARSG